MAEPCLFIEVLEGEKFAVNPAALEMLNSYEMPVRVVSVAGVYRSGKSSLMNWLRGLSGDKGGFGVGNTTKRHTRGVWMIPVYPPAEYTEVYGSAAESCSTPTILLDTEGIGSVETDSKYDARIFSLAVLLSNTILFNAMGSIDENAISNLSFIAQLSSMIQTKAKEGEDGVAIADALDFPYFVWVVRDFALQLQDEDGDPISAHEYLEQSLRPTDGFDRGTLERNKTRHLLTEFFPERTCVTLVRPLVDEEELQQASQRAPDTLRPEFVEGLELLKNIAYAPSSPSSLSSPSSSSPPATGKMNGRMFGALASVYVNAINDGGVPNVTTAWEGVSQKECELAVDGALSAFSASINQCRYPMEEVDFERTHKDAASAALALFDERSVGQAETVQRHRLDLMARFTTMREESVDENLTESTRACENLLDQFLTRRPVVGEREAKQGLESADENLLAWEKSWLALVTDYSSGQALGPAKWHVLHSRVIPRCLEEATALSMAKRNASALHDLHATYAVLELELERREKDVAGVEAELATRLEQLAEYKKKASVGMTATGTDEGALKALENDVHSVKMEANLVENDLEKTKDSQSVATSKHDRLKAEVEGIKETKRTVLTQEQNLDSLRDEVRELSAQNAKAKGCCVVS